MADPVLVSLSWSFHRSPAGHVNGPDAPPRWPPAAPPELGPDVTGQPPDIIMGPGHDEHPIEAVDPGPTSLHRRGPAGEVPSPAHPGPAGPRLAWLRQSTFRSRISILVAVAVGISVTLAAAVTYVAAREELNSQVNSSLNAAINLLPGAQAFPFGGTLDPEPWIRFQDRTGDVVQVLGINADTGQEGVWSVQASTGDFRQSRFFNVDNRAQQVFQNGSDNPVFQTLAGRDGNAYRVATVSMGNHLAIQIGYPMGNTDRTLAFLRFMLLLVVLGGIALAMALGWGVGKATMKPVEGLTLAAEHVAETQDLTATIDDSGNDELARLARSFNAMLAALSASRLQQAHLVSDAGHELRTPLTSLRTNIEVLMRNRNLADADRDELLGDVEAQLQELTNLVGDLVDLAREDERAGAQPELVDLDQLVQRAVDRARRRAMSVNFKVSLQPGHIQAQPALLERAIMNVLDNAAKWSPAGGTVTVTLSSGPVWLLRVTDQGPGIAAEDLPHVFERFYRAASARSLPGSGLGLAIVHRVITSHGGTVKISSPPSGGTEVDLTLPLMSSDPGNSDSGLSGSGFSGAGQSGSGFSGSGLSGSGYSSAGYSGAGYSSAGSPGGQPFDAVGNASSGPVATANGRTGPGAHEMGLDAEQPTTDQDRGAAARRS